MLGSIRDAIAIELTARERLRLESLTKGRSSSLRARERAAIILLAAVGPENQEIAARLGQDKMKAGPVAPALSQRRFAGDPHTVNRLPS